ncbi:hypothetical protein [Kocuria sp.]|uniref:hypothetical protein n=1 Tax=Kocuria sp. TaxID=1871328 RepID=UPI0026DF52DB|nr:hypothetical protein [Kocuria sp.]MDO5617255.1 hypothetical protein [Kocuria sp.]
MTDWLDVLVPLLSASLGALVGGFLVHHLASVREVRGARRAQRTDYLVHAYRRLIDAANRPGGPTDEQIAGLEASLSDVMLLGETQEVEAARRFMVGMAESGEANLNEVIMALRSSLRRELGLPACDLDRPYNLRMERRPQGKSAVNRRRGGV